jgi:hypothetical protein
MPVLTGRMIPSRFGDDHVAQHPVDRLVDRPAATLSRLARAGRETDEEDAKCEGEGRRASAGDEGHRAEKKISYDSDTKPPKKARASAGTKPSTGLAPDPRATVVEMPSLPAE